MKHLEQESLSTSGLSLIGRTRSHHVVFERGRGATGFYSESDDGWKAAQREVMSLRGAGGDGDVIRLDRWTSYETIDVETGVRVNKIHGVNDGYLH